MSSNNAEHRHTMEHRHLVCVYFNGRFAVAQQGHFDGYPESTGLKTLEFLRTPCSIDRLKFGLRYISVARGAKTIPCGADILARIARLDRTPARVEVGSDLDFASDSLLCSCAYVVDLDHGVLEVYKSVWPESRLLNEGYVA